MSKPNTPSASSQKYTPIKQFTIFGERCSGTHFLQYAIRDNFNIPYIKGEKHFMGNKSFREAVPLPTNNPSLREKELQVFDNANPDELLVLAIVRDPVEWIDSFFKRPHHVHKNNCKTVEQFVSNEFYSIYEEGPTINQEIMEDRHWDSKKRYKNIFELRRWKCKYMLEELPKQYKYYYFIKYEDLRDNYTRTLEKICETFAQYGMRPKYSLYSPVVKYKGTYNNLYVKKPILLSSTMQKCIWDNVDIEQEASMGYTCP